MRYRRFPCPTSLVFLTLVTQARRPMLTRPAVRSALSAALNHVKVRHPMMMLAFVVLPDHCHFLLALPESDPDFSRRVRLIKTFMAHRPGLPRAIWQKAFWGHMIRCEADLDRHLDYIHYNPVKHGLVSKVMDWPDSSFAHWVERGWYEAHWGSIPPDMDGKFGE